MLGWTWFDGKKTTIAAGVLVASAFAEQVLVGIWGVTWPWLPQAMQTADWIGMVLGGAGLVHKGVKLIPPAQPGT